MITGSADDLNKTRLDEIEDVVLASYSGEAFFPFGIKLSALQQCHLDEIMDEVFNRGYRTSAYCPLSQEDKERFRDEQSHNAEIYGEMRPECFLELLWRAGAKVGDRFYDLGSGTGKLITIAHIVGLRAAGVELSRARCEVAWKAAATLTKVAKSQRYAASFPALSTVALDCKCESMFEVDFMDADIVCFCSLLFPKEMVVEVARIACNMRPGSRIISHHRLDSLCEQTCQGFERVGELHVATSWSQRSTMFLYERLDK